MSKDYNMTLRAANTALKEMEAAGLFTKESGAAKPQVKDEEFTLGKDTLPTEEAPTLGEEQQPTKEKPFTLGEETSHGDGSAGRWSRAPGGVRPLVTG